MHEIIEKKQELADISADYKQAEANKNLMEKFMGLALSRTNASDWVLQNNKPYLQSSGCEKLMPVFGISIKNIHSKKDEYEDEEGKYYIYTYEGDFSWRFGGLEATGTRGSRDKFLGNKPLPEINEPNIKKASYSNMLVNGITRLLGIRNLTRKELEKYGITFEDVATVEYKTTAAEDRQKQKEIANMLLTINDQDQEMAKKDLFKLTEFTMKDGKYVSGVDGTEKLMGKRLQFTYEKVKKEYKIFQNNLEESKNGTNRNP